MAKKVIHEVLQDRAALIAHICSPFIGVDFATWGNYQPAEGLVVNNWDDSYVDYRRGKTINGATIMLKSISPRSVHNIKESEPFEISSKLVDAATIDSDNSNGDHSLSWGPYTGEFESTTSRSKAFTRTFTQSAKNTFTAGSIFTPVKNAFSIALGFEEGLSDKTEATDRKDRSFSFHGETPPGEHEKITAWRRVSKMRSTITGNGDYEHTIEIGRHWEHRWHDDAHHQWNTFADFVRCAKGEAPPKFPLAADFRKKPVDPKLLKELEKPLDLPFTQTLDFDSATVVQLKVIPIEASK